MISSPYLRSLFFTAIILPLCLFVTTASAFPTNKSAYVRLGGGAAFSQDTHFSDKDCNSTSPAALFGCSTGNDGKAIGAYGDFGTSYALDFGMGYKWNKWLKTEISVTYRPNFVFSGRSNFSQVSTDFEQTVDSDLKSLSGMVVGVVEPLTLFGLDTGKIKPLVTAGMGIAHNSIDSMTYTFPSTATTTPSGEHTGFAWSAGAGLFYEYTDTIGIELGYRYCDLGEVHTDVDEMIITRRSTNQVISDTIPINTTKADLEVHEILLSVTWFF